MSEGEPTSFDNFRRRLGGRAPSFGIALFLHAVLALGLAIVLWGDDDRYGRSVAEALVANTKLGRGLIAIGVVALVATGALGVRMLRPSHTPRWRWPVSIPGLVLALGMVAPFSWAGMAVGSLGDRSGAVAPTELFTLSAFALGAGASIARVGFAFGAACLSLAAWAYAISAASETQGGPPRVPALPAVLVIAAVVAGIAIGGEPLELWLVFAILGAGAIALVLTRATPAGANSTRDLVVAGVSLSAAGVLAALFHWGNHVVNAVPIGGMGGASFEVMHAIAKNVGRGEDALSLGLWIACGAFVATIVAGASRREHLREALRGVAVVGLAAVAAALVPLGIVHYRVKQSVESLVVATRLALPSDLELPRAPATVKGERLLGEVLRIGSSSTGVGGQATKNTADYADEVSCKAFASGALLAQWGPVVPAAIDRRVPYRNVACLLGAVAESLRGTLMEGPLAVLGEIEDAERLPSPFQDVQLPPAAWAVHVGAVGWDASAAKYLHATPSDGWHVGGEGRAVSLAAALQAVGAKRPPSPFERTLFAISARPDTPWQIVFEAVAHLSEHGPVVLGLPRDKPERWEPPAPPKQPEASEKEPEPEESDDEDSDEALVDELLR